jgi:hypothetical protein
MLLGRVRVKACLLAHASHLESWCRCWSQDPDALAGMPCACAAVTRNACLSSSSPFCLQIHAQVASIFEFTGAVALGGQVTKTVSGGITSPEYFANVPEVCEAQVHH